MLTGYARVSTEDQSLAIQHEALKAAGCARIFSERLSGKSLERPALVECLASLASGDTLLVTRIDRLARNTRDLLNILADLEARRVSFRALHQPGMDTTSIYSRLVLQIMAAVAEFEVSMTAERRREGIAKAQRDGKYVRPKHLAAMKRARELRTQGLTVSRVAATLTDEGMPNTIRSVYRLTRGMWGQPEEQTDAF